MKKEYFIIGLVAILFLIWYINIADFSPKKDNELLIKVSILEQKLDSLNNQKFELKKIVDSTHVKIINNEKHYQERVTTIISQPDSVSELFTRQYLRNYAAIRGYSIIGTSEVE